MKTKNKDIVSKVKKNDDYQPNPQEQELSAQKLEDL